MGGVEYYYRMAYNNIERWSSESFLGMGGLGCRRGGIEVFCEWGNDLDWCNY